MPGAFSCGRRGLRHSPRGWLDEGGIGRDRLQEGLASLAKVPESGVAHIPDEIVIDVIVCIRDPVPKSDNPRKIRNPVHKMWDSMGEAFQGLADNLKVPLYGGPQLTILGLLLLGRVLQPRLNLLGPLQHVMERLKTGAIRLRRHRGAGHRPQGRQ